MSTPTRLSQVTVQVDTRAVIEDIEQCVVEAENLWVSCYHASKPSVHGKVRVAIDEEVRDRLTFVGWDGVSCEQISKYTLSISCPALHISGRIVRFPELTNILVAETTTRAASKIDHAVTSLDVSPDGQSCVVGLGDGSVVVQRKGAPPVISKVHKTSVSTVKLLEGTGNVLSGSDDFSLCLSSPSSTTPILRLTGHTRPVTSISLVLDSTQVVSTGKDGTLRIWDISPSLGKQLAMLRSSGDAPINALSTCEPIAAVALQSGHFDLLDLHTRITVFSTTSPGFEHTRAGPLTAIKLHAISGAQQTHLLVTGSQNGILAFYVCAVRDGGMDVRQIGSCVRNGAGISCIDLVASISDQNDAYPSVLIATSDGLPYQLQLTPSSNGVGIEIAAEYAGGADCSPVLAIVGNAELKKTWMAGDNGVVWVYDL